MNIGGQKSVSSNTFDKLNQKRALSDEMATDHRHKEPLKVLYICAIDGLGGTVRVRFENYWWSPTLEHRGQFSKKRCPKGLPASLLVSS